MLCIGRFKLIKTPNGKFYCWTAPNEWEYRTPSLFNLLKYLVLGIPKI